MSQFAIPLLLRSGTSGSNATDELQREGGPNPQHDDSDSYEVSSSIAGMSSSNTRWYAAIHMRNNRWVVGFVQNSTHSGECHCPFDPRGCVRVRRRRGQLRESAEPQAGEQPQRHAHH